MKPSERDTLISAGDNRAMFDRIAPRYDLLNTVMSLGLHRYWRKVAVRHLLSGGGLDFLDIGCGTGEIALEVLQQSPAAKVAGIDPAVRMLKIAADKAGQEGLSGRVIYKEGDATMLLFPDASFDGIVCAFCLRNITNRSAALSEMRRVLRPEGTLAILELTAPRNKLLKGIHTFYTHGIIPLMGQVMKQGNAYQYLADSIDHFPSPPVIVDELIQAGFTGAQYSSLTGGFVTLFH
ncbi:MAG: bifunctional demethylmenaquinone methyltransferase/2-methoxy-6-polyprenyl-1,4-benzoquinol methylase UbiE [bacterium]